MAQQSKTITEAGDRIANEIAACSGIDFPGLSTGPYEEVLVFEAHAQSQLRFDANNQPYFYVWGNLADVSGKTIKGSKIETPFQVDPKTLPEITQWPALSQGAPPYNAPPVDISHAQSNGNDKTQFTFGDGSTIVAVGPTIAKLALTKKGSSGQLWVTSVLVSVLGTGKYDGVKALIALNGSSFFQQAPDPNTPEGIKTLSKPFGPVRISINMKLIRQGNLA